MRPSKIAFTLVSLLFGIVVGLGAAAVIIGLAAASAEAQPVLLLVGLPAVALYVFGSVPLEIWEQRIRRENG